MQAACQDAGFFVLPCTVLLFTHWFYPTKSPPSRAGRGAVCIGSGILPGSSSGVPGGTLAPRGFSVFPAGRLAPPGEKGASPSLHQPPGCPAQATVANSRCLAVSEGL